MEHCSDVSGRLRSSSRGGVGVGSGRVLECKVIVSIRAHRCLSNELVV
jgi:hypothetical protein